MAAPAGPSVVGGPDAAEDRTPRTGEQQRAAGMRPKVGMRANLWDVGATLKVRFLNGSPDLRSKVTNAALQWLEYANLKFEFGDDQEAPIRISFDRDGSWAYQGTDCFSVPAHEPTVNFGWLTDTSSRGEIDDVVLHEFGHVLGLQHEHGNPASTLKWNRQKVYEQLGGPPNHWSRTQVDHNVFAIWPPAYFPVHKVFDPQSIMMMQMPAEFFLDGKQTISNHQLSPLDKQFAAALYPLRWSQA